MNKQINKTLTKALCLLSLKEMCVIACVWSITFSQCNHFKMGYFCLKSVQPLNKWGYFTGRLTSHISVSNWFANCFLFCHVFIFSLIPFSCIAPSNPTYSQYLQSNKFMSLQPLVSKLCVSISFHLLILRVP